MTSYITRPECSPQLKLGGSNLRGCWSGTGHSGAVTIAGGVFHVGGCCCAKIFSELRGAVIGVEVEVVGGPDWVAAGAVLTTRTESVETAEVEVERGVREV